MKKIILSGEEAREKLLLGVNKLADIVTSTIGPAGRNIIIDRPFQDPHITNDGVTVAKEIVLDDEIEELGAKVIKEASKRQNDDVGDGTTSVTAILSGLINSLNKNKNPLLADTRNVMDLKREIESECTKAVDLLKKNSKEVKTLEDIINIASISMENREIGEIIGKLYRELGPDGLVKVEMGSGFEIESEIKDGYEIPFGLISPAFTTEEGKNTTTKPLILATNIKLNQAKQVKPIVQELISRGQKDLVIFAEHFDKEVVISFIQVKMLGQFNPILIKIPSGKEDVFEDICSITGAKFVNENNGDTIEGINVSGDLGTIKSITASKDSTILIGGKATNIETLKEKLKNEKSEYEKDLLTKRIAKLNGKIGIITVGAKTENEKGYLKDKIDDAVNATKWAMKEGCVKGGGLALKEIAEQMKDSILYEGLMAPHKKITENAGKELEITDNIIDPTAVVRLSLENACSIAGTFITTGAAIADKIEKKKDIDKE